MKASRRFALIAGTVLLVLAGISFHKVALAQSQQTPQWMLDEAKLPPDVHPDTLSRMPRPKESDYATDEEKALFNRVMHRNPTQATMLWLGPTGTRVAIPELAGGGEGEGGGESAVDPKYRQLAVEAINRESDNPEEFIGHEADVVKGFDMGMLMVLINRKDTAGLDPKAAAIIEFARDLFKYPRTAPVSAKVFADLQQNFGKRGTLEIASTALTYGVNFLELRAYDQHMDTNAGCPMGRGGCLDLKNPPLAWEVPTTYKPMKEQSMAEWLAGQAKLPPDVHPESLSRMPRPQESDYTNDKEKEAFSKIMGQSDAPSTGRWLGPIGTRLAIPRLVDGAERTHDVIYSKGGVDNKYLELTVAVTTRELGDRQEFINHEDDAVKAYGKDLEDIVRLRKSTQGLDDPKAAAIIEFGRDLFSLPRTVTPSSKHFADLEQNFGKKGALAIIALMAYYDNNWILLRVYDQHMDTNADCVPGLGCLNLKNPPLAW